MELPRCDQIASLCRQEIAINHGAESGKAKPGAITGGLIDLDGVELLSRDLLHAFDGRIVDLPICTNALGRLRHSQSVLERFASTPITRNTPRCHDGLVEQRVAIRTIRHHLQPHRDPPKALTEDGDVVGIPAKSRDVILDPLQRQVLILESQVLSLGRVESVGRREAEDADAVVDGHVDDRLIILDGLFDEPLRLVEVVVCFANNGPPCWRACNQISKAAHQITFSKCLSLLLWGVDGKHSYRHRDTPSPATVSPPSPPPASQSAGSSNPRSATSHRTCMARYPWTAVGMRRPAWWHRPWSPLEGRRPWAA